MNFDFEVNFPFNLANFSIATSLPSYAYSSLQLLVKSVKLYLAISPIIVFMYSSFKSTKTDWPLGGSRNMPEIYKPLKHYRVRTN